MSKNDYYFDTSNQCEICKGAGLVKNINMICDLCHGTRCKHFTEKHVDYAPYEFCHNCGGDGKHHNNLNTQISCKDCIGSGFVKKENINYTDCNKCESPHLICSCCKPIYPYIECIVCLGSGKKYYN